MSSLSKIGDRSTSDVVVRLRTHDGRDEWIYCHSNILVEKSKFFADRLSETWPTCQILDSRNCVEIYCQEAAFDHHVNVLRMLYVVIGDSVEDIWHGVKNTLGVLEVALELGCTQIVTTCVKYLEAVPWEEAEEEEILKKIPALGSVVEPVIARLQPVKSSAIVEIFISGFQFATSSPPSQMNDLKNTAQEQLEYMITEDDDSPLLIAKDEIKVEVMECVKRLFVRFSNLLEALVCESSATCFEAGNIQSFKSHLSDLSWASQIMVKMEIMREFVKTWVDASDKIVNVVTNSKQTAESVEIKFKTIEVTAKVLEAIGYGTVILPTPKRIHMVKVWLPFVRVTKPLIDSVTTNDEAGLVFKLDGEIWQSLESTFVSMVLALPSGDQAEVLSEWLGNKHIQYPDLTEAFEVWCYRSKVAKRRLALLGTNHTMLNGTIF